MNTIFQRTNISEPALFSPSDTTKKIGNFPEICVSTFSEKIIQKFYTELNHHYQEISKKLFVGLDLLKVNY